MSASRPTQHLTHEDYFALERTEDQRYEYLAGSVFAMTGGTERHALISMNVGAGLFNAFRERPCRVYGPDMRLYIADHDKFCYPDAMVLCQEGRRFERYVEQPVIVVEVLSESTEKYDRGRKFQHYRSIPSLLYYLLLDQNRPVVELYHRESTDLWTLRALEGNDAVVELMEWELRLPLAEIYRNVEFDLTDQGD